MGRIVLVVGCSAVVLACSAQPRTVFLEKDAEVVIVYVEAGASDAGGGDVTVTDPTDAGDGGVEAGAASHLGSACDPSNPQCKSFTHPAYQGIAGGVCYNGISAMYGRCTFECFRPKAGGGWELDAEKVSLCQAFNGACKAPEVNAPPHCIPN
jgi:hypothetical protein